ncbi:MAG: GxxExxY protein [Rubripirellula sp.]
MAILFTDESYKIIDACFSVYNEQGSGFVEPVYQECLEIEMRVGVRQTYNNHESIESHESKSTSSTNK